MNFTFNDYEKSLLEAQKINYIITSSKNFVDLYNSGNIPKKFIILRHDCERDLAKAHKMALIENKLGIKSTFVS